MAMQREQKISKRNENYPMENRLETEKKQGEPSKAVVSPGKKDGGSETYNLLEEILGKENMTRALKRVKANKGSCGVDGMRVEELQPYLKNAWSFIKADILDSSYKPKAVKCVMIPKASGGERMLGIPTVLDRLIQQGIAQVLSRRYDPNFSPSSYGFRPGRNAHEAVKQAQCYINEGNRYIVDIDLEKFFDRVNHDRLMSLLAKEIKDKRLLRLIRKYLETGIMKNGIMEHRSEGTPQGSPLSPILSNIVLDELDKELEKRGHKFCRYADDCSIYVKSPKAGQRILDSITRYISKKLRLKVNEAKSSVKDPEEMKLLGFSFYRRKKEPGYGIIIAERSVAMLKEKIKALTQRNYSISLEDRLLKLNQTMKGWMNYFVIADGKSSIAGKIDAWTRFRLRMCIWKTWKRIRTRIRKLTELGMSPKLAVIQGNTRKGYCRTAQSPILKLTLTNAYLQQLGYVGLSKLYSN